MEPKFPEKYRIQNPFIDSFLIDEVFITVSDHDDYHHLVLSNAVDKSKPVPEEKLKDVIEKLFRCGYVFNESRPEGLQGPAQHYDVKRLEV